MEFISHYSSPLGPILLAADHIGLTGLWFEGQKHYALHLKEEVEEQELPVFVQAKQWLDTYFAGQTPDFTPPLHFKGTAFQNKVWTLLMEIPYGQTVTYGQLARQLEISSAQAVGGAVGRNPISVIVPCHRVLGAKGQLTGYAGGLEKKQYLLTLEGIL